MLFTNEAFFLEHATVGVNIAKFALTRMHPNTTTVSNETTAPKDDDEIRKKLNKTKRPQTTNASAIVELTQIQTGNINDNDRNATKPVAKSDYVRKLNRKFAENETTHYATGNGSAEIVAIVGSRLSRRFLADEKLFALLSSKLIVVPVGSVIGLFMLLSASTATYYCIRNL